MYSKFKYEQVACVSNIPIYVCTDEEYWDNVEGKGMLAYMFGKEVFIKSRKYFTPSVLAHELAHVKQLRRERNEFMFRVKVMWARTVAHAVCGNADNNAYEHEALVVEKEFKHKLLTDVAEADWS